MVRHLLAFGTEHYIDGSDRLVQVPAELDEVVKLFTAFEYTEQLTELRHDPAVATLRPALELWLRDAARSPDDVAVVYYTGHGFTEDGVHYLAASDTRAGSVVTALASEDFVRLLGTRSPLRRLLLILDVCDAGAGVLDAAAFARRLAPYQTQVGRGEGIWILAAARAREAAQQGAFARALNGAVRALTDTSGNSQEHLAFEPLMELVNRRLPGSQQAGYGAPPFATGLPPFLPNRHYEPSALAGEDLEAAARTPRVRELAPHWDPKSRGVDVARQAGSYFTGRDTAVEAVLTWLRQPGDGPACVVTGQPGAGKSALLGHILFLTHPELRGNGHPPPSGARIGSAILARGKSDVAVLDELVSDLGVGTMDARALGKALAAADDDTTVLIDALDEAEVPNVLIHEVLQPLLEEGAGRVRLLLGTRRSELAKLPFRYQAIDLDAREFYRSPDVAEYVVAVLLDRYDPSSTSPYRHAPEAARAVAEFVAERAGKSFLVARVAARTLARSARALAPDEVGAASRLWNAVGRAFDQDLARYGEDALRVRDLLLPLAYARGAGLPWETVWAPLASALSDTAYDDDDIGWLHAHAGAYIVEATDEGRAVYRLVHQELADHLRRGSDEKAAEGRVVEVLLELVPTNLSGRRDWLAAHRYVRGHVARHAAKAVRIDELLEDAGFLIAADPTALTRASAAARSESGKASADVYRLALEQLVGRPPPERSATIALAARQRGIARLADAADALFPDPPWRALWSDWQGPDPHRILTRMAAAVSAVVAFWGPDGRSLAAAGDLEGTLRLIDEEQAEIVEELSLGSAVWSLCVADLEGDRLLLAGTYDGRLHVVRTDDWHVTDLQAHDTAVGAMTSGKLDESPVVVTGGRGATGTDSGSLRVWDARGTDAADWAPRTPAYALFGGSVSRLHLVELGGRTVVLAAGDPLYDPEDAGGMVRFLDPSTGERIGSLDTTGTALIDAELDAAGALITRTYVGGLSDRLSVWDIRKRAETADSSSDHGSGMALARVLADGRPAIATPTTQTVELRDPQSLEPLAGWRPITVSGVRVLCPALDGRLLVTGGEDGAVRLWDLGWPQTTAGTAAPARGRRLVAAGASPRGPLAMIAGPNASEVRGLRDGRRHYTLPAGHVDAIAFGEKHMFLAERGSVRSYSLDGAPGAVLGGDAPGVQAIAVGNDQHRSILAIACSDCTVRLVDRDTGESLSPPLHQSSHSDEQLYALTFAAVQGELALVAGGATGDLLAWNLNGLAQSELPGGSRHYVRALAIGRGRDADVLFSGADDGELVALDLSHLTVAHRHKQAHRGRINAISVTGPHVISGGRDGVLRVWNFELEPRLAISLDAEVTSLAALDGLVLAGTMAGVVALDLSVAATTTAPSPARAPFADCSVPDA